MQCRFPFFEKRLVLCLLFSFKGVKNEFVFGLRREDSKKYESSRFLIIKNIETRNKL